jgi:hypothetical protein
MTARRSRPCSAWPAPPLSPACQPPGSPGCSRRRSASACRRSRETPRASSARAAYGSSAAGPTDGILVMVFRSARPSLTPLASVR